MKIRNALYNYYAISRFEMEKYQSDKTNPLYLVNYYAENVLKSILNNCFGISLINDAIELYQLLVNIEPSFQDDKLLEDLTDSATYFDSKLLRPYDPDEKVMAVLRLYLQKYLQYDKTDDEEVLKHRYDIILNEMTTNESYGSLLIKINNGIANSNLNLCKELFKLSSQDYMVTVLTNIRYLCYSASICLLFKDDEGLKKRLNHLVIYLISMIAYFDKGLSKEEMIRDLSLYVDIQYSNNHNIKLPKMEASDQILLNEWGFLAIGNVAPKIDDLVELYLKSYDGIVNYSTINSLFIRLLDKISSLYEGEEINKLTAKMKEMISDLDVLFTEMKR